MKYRNMLLAVCLGFSGMLSAQSVYPGQHRGKMMKEAVVYWGFVETEIHSFN